MQNVQRKTKVIASVSGLALLCGGASLASASQPPGLMSNAAVQGATLAAAPQPPGPFPDVYPKAGTVTIPGDRDGNSTFATARYPEIKPLKPGKMDWKHYHSLPEIEWWLTKWAYEHPDIAQLETVGTSFGGHPIYQLTITNKTFGKDTDKPAAYFDGGRHSGEITATEAALYDAWTLIENYGKDRDITKMVNEKTIYIRPVPNPDGSEMYRQTAQTDRSTVRPHDDDRDGKLDEDSGDDLNGDGYVTQMRKDVGAGKGNYIIDSRDPSGATMRQVAQGEGNYVLYSEGIDNDGDGRINEDGIGGLDLHRNFPYNWRPESEDTGRGNTQGGSGAYPLSEPEMRSMVLFLLAHPNVGAVDSMDTAAWMILRGPSTCEPTECVHPKDLKLLKSFDKVGQQITGYGRAGDTYRTYATQDAFGNVRPGAKPVPLFGHGLDWGYFQFGAVWYGDELWNRGATMTDVNGDGTVEDWEQQRDCQARKINNCFLPWTKYTHPTYGPVEIGGKNPKFFSQNPPAAMMEPWAANESEFNLHLVKSLAQVQVVKTRIKKLPTPGDDGATHEIAVTVENTGLIPTALQQAKEVKIVKPDTVQITLPDGTGKILGEKPEFWLESHQRKTITVRTVLDVNKPPKTLTVSAQSTRGGVDTQKIYWSQAQLKKTTWSQAQVKK